MLLGTATPNESFDVLNRGFSAPKRQSLKTSLFLGERGNCTKGSHRFLSIFFRTGEEVIKTIDRVWDTYRLNLEIDRYIHRHRDSEVDIHRSDPRSRVKGREVIGRRKREN
tara:strand:+ start:127 stop:459 length:333 start_codon:yes stop_codon:yes gene_type:complete